MGRNSEKTEKLTHKIYSTDTKHAQKGYNFKKLG